MPWPFADIIRVSGCIEIEISYRATECAERAKIEARATVRINVYVCLYNNPLQSIDCNMARDSMLTARLSATTLLPLRLQWPCL